MALRFHSLKVAAVSRETEDAASVVFEVPKGLRDRFRHKPGQYLTLSRDFAGVNARRTYSIHEPTGGRCAVLVKRVPEGLFSGYVNDELRPGDSMDVLEPAGTFGHGIDPQRENHVFAYAAGSGITPVLPLIETVLDGNPRSAATLVYCNKSTSSIIFRDRLANLKDSNMRRLDIAHVLTREKQDVPLLHGRITKGRAARLVEVFATNRGPKATCLLCGPEQLMDAMEAALLGRGFKPGQIHRERFNAPKSAGRSKGKRTARRVEGTCQVRVLLNNTQNELTVPKGPTLLESIKAHGLEAPFSCTAGVCSTCRARLREGTVEMDANYALEDEEVKDGVILACQARPTSERVFVDFDSLWG